MKTKRVVGRTGIVRWVPDLDAEAAAVEGRRVARRRQAIDKLIAHPDVWERIAEHAQDAAADRGDAWARDVFAALAQCARVLAAGPTPVDDGEG